MAEIRELVLTFLERLSHHALPKNRKRETLDACISLQMWLPFYYSCQICQATQGPRGALIPMTMYS